MAKKYFFGFTLVELMVVLSIIAVLAALIVAYFTGQILKGNDARRKGDLNSIKVASEEFEKDHNCYPGADKMNKCGTDPGIAVHPYLNNVPCDPTTGKPYGYDTDSSACPGWFRDFAALQNTQDSAIIPGIGPSGKFNFYLGSANAPTPVGTSPTSIPSALPSGGGFTGYWGCVNGQCQRVDLSSPGHPNCNPSTTQADCANLPCTSPVYDCKPI